MHLSTRYILELHVQSQELGVLQAQLAMLRERTYPVLDRANAQAVPYWAAAPDLRIPHLSPGTLSMLSVRVYV
jgi:hypothetical protein